MLSFRPTIVVMITVAVCCGLWAGVSTPSASSKPASSAATDGSTATSRPADQKRERIRYLLELTGAANMGKQVASNLMATFKSSPAFRRVPDAFWDEMIKEIRPEDLIDIVVPIYDRHFSLDDINAAIAFYETPSGKRMISELPQVMQESMAAGKEWGQQVAQKAMQRLKQLESDPNF